MTYRVTFLESASFLFCQGFPTLIIDMREWVAEFLGFIFLNTKYYSSRVIMNKMNLHRERISSMWRSSNVVLSAIVYMGLVF